MASGAPVTLDAWNTTLADVLLPEQPRAGMPVLFACDDEAVRVAARRLGADDTYAAEQLVGAVRGALAVDYARGFGGALAPAARWRAQARPRPVPPFLAALGVAVLAASRMDRDEKYATQAYYARLADLLGIPLRDEWPAVARFDALVGLFSELRDWLADDLGGRRGHLAAPPVAPNVRVVGIPIAQTPLRGRDRRILGGFFYRYERSLQAGFDPLRLLRAWGGRERLTAPARALLDRDEVADAFRAALRAAFSAWDGSRIDADGRRLLPARLRLGANAQQVTLNLSLPGSPLPRAATSPYGPITLPADPLELTLPPQWLRLAADGPVTLDCGTAGSVRALPGSTMLFEFDEIGLYLTPAAHAESVWVLSCDPRVTNLPWAPEQLHGAPLEPGWQLIVDVSPHELPDDMRTAPMDERELVAGAALIGGLPLGDGAYLLDHPPAVLSDLPQPAHVEIDGRQAGEIDPGRPLGLDDIAHRPGSHSVWVSDDVELVFELAPRGRREGTGLLRHYLTAPAGITAGAAPEPPAGCPPVPAVAGAVLDGAGEPQLAAGLLVRHNATVEIIYRDGSVGASAPPVMPLWQRAAGIEPGERWEVPDGDNVAFLCVFGRRKHVVAVHDGPVDPSNEALDLVDEYGDAPVIDRTPGRGGAAVWQELVRAARANAEVAHD